MRLKLNGCDLEVWRCGKKVQTIPLGSCSGGGGTTNETLTTLDSVTLNGNILEVRYTGENGVQQVKSEDLSAILPTSYVQSIDGSSLNDLTLNLNYTDGLGVNLSVPIDLTGLPANMISSELGNALMIGADGKLVVNIPAQLPDDQTLTDSGLGNVSLILTPTTSSDGTVNYTITANVNSATTTPSGQTNAIQLDSNNKLYVEPSTFKNTRFIATASQTSFNLSFTPKGAIQMFRNGSFIDSLAYTVSGNTVTYIPANNVNALLGDLVAGDIIHFYGV